MIAIERGPEPESLRVARRRHLARAVRARRAGQTPVFDGYNLEEVRRRLYECQHWKCAYCEIPIRPEGYPIEHFRPKGGAIHSDPLDEDSADRVRSRDHYWWLAWSWNNLFFACPGCNSAGFKGNWFPLEPGAGALQVPDGLLPDSHPCFALGLERRLLVDPSFDDPLDHMIWRPLDPVAPDRTWRALPRSERGKRTIKIFGFDGRNVDRVNEHIRLVVKPWSKRIGDCRARHDTEAVTALWQEALQCLFAPSQPFQAATHDALDWYIPEAERRAAGLVLPRPRAIWEPSGIRAASAMSQGEEPSPDLHLPDDVVLELHAEELSTRELIELICGTRPSTEAELATLLGLQTQTLRHHCSDLATAGRLVRDADEAWVRPSPAPA